jgi:hypothetical protein
MVEPNHLSAWSREELLALVAERQRQSAEVRASHDALGAEIDPLTRGGKRPAAPVSKGTRGAEPKPPGRKPGAGTFRSRAAPPPAASTAPPVDGRVPHDAGPAGGGPRAEDRVDVASRPEIPALPHPQVPRYRGWV